MVPEPAAFSAVMQALDIRRKDTVVLYDQASMTGCCKAAFTLRCFGLNVRVLECPLTKWISEGRATTSEIAEVQRTAGSAEDYAYELDSSKIATY